MTRNRTENRSSVDKESMLARLAKWDDDVEAEKQTEEYYKDHQLWTHKRVETRRKEIEKDERDRESEKRETDKGQSRAAALADSFLEQQAFEIGAKVNADVLSGVPQPLRLRMTRENIKTTPASPVKRSIEETEGLLEEDEEDEGYQTGSKKKRSLIRLDYEGEDSRENDTSKQNQLRTLVSSIPSDTQDLWEYPIHWEGLDNVRPSICVVYINIFSRSSKAKSGLLPLRKLLKRSVSKSRILLTLLCNIFLITDRRNRSPKNLKWFAPTYCL
jgi:hypothetical protein